MTLKWSHSGLKDFESCAKRFHEVKVLKKYPFTDTIHTTYGKEVHSAIEAYGRDGTPLPPAFDQFKPVVDAILAKPGRKLFELEMGVKADLTPCGFKDEDVWARGIADIAIINDDNFTARVGDWKGLALDTALPTPTGWTTMGAVSVGDGLFAQDGSVCTVTGKSEVKHLPCYRIVFDDTTTVVCDEEHLWPLHTGAVVSVKALRRNDRILLAAPLALPDTELLVDPYVLGLWLADGKRSSGEISKPDAFVWEEIQRRGYKVNMQTGGSGACPTRTVHGLAAQLDMLGLWRNKHIPTTYLRAGYQQRLDLLRGLMDGDGNANTTRQQAIFTSTDKELSDQVCDLVAGLGMRPLQSRVLAHGFGLEVEAFPISFRPFINPFLLPRKADRIDIINWGRARSWYRRVVEVQPVASVPTQCIRVDSDDHTFLCTEKMLPTHNTGGDKYPDRDQLVLMSLMIFAHYPHIRRVSSALLFLVKGSMVKHSMERDEAEGAWWAYRGRVAKLEAAHANNIWPMNPTPLCGWCPVHTCAHYKPRKGS